MLPAISSGRAGYWTNVHRQHWLGGVVGVPCTTRATYILQTRHTIPFEQPRSIKRQEYYKNGKRGGKKGKRKVGQVQGTSEHVISAINSTNLSSRWNQAPLRRIVRYMVLSTACAWPVCAEGARNATTLLTYASSLVPGSAYVCAFPPAFIDGLWEQEL